MISPVMLTVLPCRGLPSTPALTVVSVQAFSPFSPSVPSDLSKSGFICGWSGPDADFLASAFFSSAAVRVKASAATRDVRSIFRDILFLFVDSRAGMAILPGKGGQGSGRANAPSHRRATIAEPPDYGPPMLASPTSRQFDSVRSHHVPDFDGHAQLCAAGTRAARELCGDLIGALGALHVHDPVAEQELLGFGKHPIGYGHTARAGPHDLGLVRRPERRGGHKLAGFGEFLTEARQECKVRLDILLGPGPVGVHAGAGARHQQYVFHFARSF